MDHKNVREIRVDPVVPNLSVLISTARGNRPKKKEKTFSRDERYFVEGCPFCRGNENLTPPSALQFPAQGDWSIRVVENRYPILDDDPLPGLTFNASDHVMEGYGHHEVIIDHPNHGITLHQMTEQHVAQLFGVYRDRMQFLYTTDPRIRYVLIFKNFGKAAGGSMAHTHSQLIAMPIIPQNVHNEIQSSKTFYEKTGTCIFCKLIDSEEFLETTTFERDSGKACCSYETEKYIIEQGKYFVAIKPFASRYEWEVHILPIKHQSDFLQITGEELSDMAHVLKKTMARLDRVVGEVQYNYFLHTAPHDRSKSSCSDSYHWHLEICPRTSTPSGFEMGSGLFVNTIAPEDAALRLQCAFD